MAKFKVGDRVRSIENGPANGFTGFLLRDDKSMTPYLVRFDGFAEGHGANFEEWWQNENDLVPALKIEAGKFYKTRDGRKVGPIRVAQKHNDPWPWKARYGMTTYYYKHDGYSCPGSAHRHRDADDLVAEWVEPAAAVAVAARNDNAAVARGVPVVGDFVTKKSWHSGFYEVTRIDRENLWIKADGINDLRYDLKSDWIIRRAPTAIVCLIENGQPKPASVPHVHSSTASAEAEAKRLASIHRGHEFGVYVLTATSKEPAPTYGHEWQRQAAAGRKIEAIKALRAVTGMQLKPAKDVVEHFDRSPYGELAA